jgi:hypothetical protein
MVFRGGFARVWGVAIVVVALGGLSAHGQDEPSVDEKPAATQVAPPASPGDRPGREKPAYLDEMIREAWDTAKVKPSERATDAEFLRRATLDLLGRTPTVAESLAFLGNDDPNKRVKLIDALLQHPDYAKNFATVWRVALIGRGMQGQRVDRAALDSWLRVQFGKNRPWNEMAYELITASGSNKENGAANFVLSHLEGDKVPLTSITTRVFLGLQIQCTQCHDHPSNDWKQADFWGINAFFKGLDSRVVRGVDATGAEVDDYVEVFDNPTDGYSRFDRRDGTIRIVFPTYLDGRKISQGTDVNRREALGRFITDPENPDFPRAMVNRLWGHFLGRGFVNPVEDFGDHNPPSHPDLLEKLAADFRASGYDIQTLIRWITTSEAYNLSSVMNASNEKDETLFSHMALKPMTPEQLFESVLVATNAHKAGGSKDTEAKRDRWLRQFVVAFANDETQEGTSFQGTIPQALMMMNGDLMAEATSVKPGGFLATLLDQARGQRTGPEAYVVSRLYLSALSRPPTQKEMAAARTFLARSPDTIAVMQDLFWALLNSNEFILNH